MSYRSFLLAFVIVLLFWVLFLAGTVAMLIHAFGLPTFLLGMATLGAVLCLAAIWGEIRAQRAERSRQ
jgi:hypothetical protein